MTTVFDTLFLRKLRIEYNAPPVCLTNFSNASAPPASGSSIVSGIILAPITPLTPPGPLTAFGLCGNFLQFPSYPRQICYSVYFSAPGTTSYTPILECVAPGSIALCSAGYYQISAITPEGELPPGAPFLVDGTQYVVATLPSVPDATCFRLYKNPDVTNPAGTYKLYLDCFTGNVFETCATGCYTVTAITPDGETPLSAPVCLTPECDPSIWSPTCPPQYTWNGLECVFCQQTTCPPGFHWVGAPTCGCVCTTQSCPSGEHWDSVQCMCVNDYGNDAQSGTLQCPNNPAITVSGTVPAFTFTSNNPADYPWKLNSEAQQALANALFADLGQTACTCFSVVFNNTTITNNSNCDLDFQVFAPNGSFFDPTFHDLGVPAHTTQDWKAYLCGLVGCPLPGTQGYFRLPGGIHVGFTTT